MIARLVIMAAAMLLGVVANPAARADPGTTDAGVFDDRIVFGQSAALEGPAPP